MFCLLGSPSQPQSSQPEFSYAQRRILNSGDSMQPSSVGSIQESPPELPGKKGKKNICYIQGSVGFKLTHLSEVEVYEVQWLNSNRMVISFNNICQDRTNLNQH